MHAYFSLAEQYMHKKYLLALKPSTFKDGMSMKTIISPLKIFRERFKKTLLPRHWFLIRTTAQAAYSSNICPPPTQSPTQTHGHMVGKTQRECKN